MQKWLMYNGNVANLIQLKHLGAAEKGSAGQCNVGKEGRDVLLEAGGKYEASPVVTCFHGLAASSAAML